MVRVPSHRQTGEPGAGGGAGDSSDGAGPWARALMAGLKVLLILTLIVLADCQRWPSDGSCLPCQCSYKITSFGRLRFVNCSRRGLRAVPEGLPADLMALDLSWNPLQTQGLQRRLCQFKSLQSLSLTFSELTVLSEIFSECDSVLELNLTGNRLIQLDTNTFKGLRNLRRLLGLETEAIVIKEVFKGLINLTDLDLVYHGETLPEGVFDKVGLKSLNLVLTEAKALPKGILKFGMKTLTTVQLRGERLESVNDDLIRDLSHLRKLIIILPMVSTLPPMFFQSQQRLNLQEIEITGVGSVPKSTFGQLDNLESLQMKNVGSFPETDFLLGLVNLSTLVVDDSSVRRIPEDWFKGVEKLEILQLSSLQLEEIDDGAFVGLPYLNRLDLSYNSLSQLGSKVLQPLSQTLESLILTGNKLSELSGEALTGLFSLKYLDVSENRLSVVSGDALRGMTRLSVLHLASNRLSSLPAELFKDQLQLGTLSLSDNQFVQFPESVLQLRHSLISLDLSFNEIRQIPSASLCEFSDLETFSVMENPLHCDCQLLNIHRCPNIIVDGVCRTPERELGKSLRMVDVPKSCTPETTTLVINKVLSTKDSQASLDHIRKFERMPLPDAETLSAQERPPTTQSPIARPGGRSETGLSPDVDDSVSQGMVVRELFPDVEQQTPMPVKETTHRQPAASKHTAGTKGTNLQRPQNIGIKSPDAVTDFSTLGKSAQGSVQQLSKDQFQSKLKSGVQQGVDNNTGRPGSTTQKTVSQGDGEENGFKGKGISEHNITNKATNTRKDSNDKGVSTQKKTEFSVSMPSLGNLKPQNSKATGKRTKAHKKSENTKQQSMLGLVPAELPTAPLEEATSPELYKEGIFRVTERLNEEMSSKDTGGLENKDSGTGVAQSNQPRGDTPPIQKANTTFPDVPVEDNTTLVNEERAAENTSSKQREAPDSSKVPVASTEKNSQQRSSTLHSSQSGSMQGLFTNPHQTPRPVNVNIGGSSEYERGPDESKKRSGEQIESVGMALPGRTVVAASSNVDGEDESTALSFTIGAVAAVMLFGGLVISVYGIRRCQRQGSYVVASHSMTEGNEQELTSVHQEPSNMLEYSGSSKTSMETPSEASDASEASSDQLNAKLSELS